jgi:anti-sigma regulatory factor (Ser/Thr protein kinase)
MSAGVSIPTVWWMQSVPPTETGIGQARRDAVEAFRYLGVRETHLFPLELSIQEALVNALVHGVVEHGGSQIRLSCEINSDGVEVIVEDDGGLFGVDAEEVSHRVADETNAQGGHGLLLIRAFMSRVNIRSSGHVRMELDFHPVTDQVPVKAGR